MRRVTRLIKVSKQQKSARDVILATSSSSSTLSVGRPEVQVGTKLAAAQSELQACEAHLATKERELDVMRMAAVRSGLSARCKAMVECGWAWGEMGKEGLRAVESLETPLPNGNGYGMPQLALMRQSIDRSFHSKRNLSQSRLTHGRPLEMGMAMLWARPQTYLL